MKSDYEASRKNRFVVQHPNIKSYLIHKVDLYGEALKLTTWIQAETSIASYINEKHVSCILVQLLNSEGEVTNTFKYELCELIDHRMDLEWESDKVIELSLTYNFASVAVV